MGLGERFDITRDLTFEYTRLPDDVVRWRHWKLYEDAEVLVSAFHDHGLPRPIRVDGRVVVDKVLSGISYNFWDQWHNVISCYDRDLEFRGYYTDILTPVQKTWTLVQATDLFLDVFIFPDGTWTVKDEDEFEAAVGEGLMDEGIANRAREALATVVGLAEEGRWPPDVVSRIPSDPIAVLRSVRRLEKP